MKTMFLKHLQMIHFCIKKIPPILKNQGDAGPQHMLFGHLSSDFFNILPAYRPPLPF